MPWCKSTKSACVPDRFFYSLLAMTLPTAPPATSLTKADLAESLFMRIGLNKREAKDLVDTFFDTVREALIRGETVKLSGFGCFQVRHKPPRPGRNPKTGDVIPIAARRVVTFHASQKLKNAVAQSALDKDCA